MYVFQASTSEVVMYIIRLELSHFYFKVVISGTQLTNLMKVDKKEKKKVFRTREFISSSSSFAFTRNSEAK